MGTHQPEPRRREKDRDYHMEGERKMVIDRSKIKGRERESTKDEQRLDQEKERGIVKGNGNEQRVDENMDKSPNRDIRDMRNKKEGQDKKETLFVDTKVEDK